MGRYMHVCIYVNMYIVSAYVYMHIHTYAHTHLHTYTYVYINRHIHKVYYSVYKLHTLICIWITCICVCIYTHIQILAILPHLNHPPLGDYKTEIKYIFHVVKQSRTGNEELFLFYFQQSNRIPE